MLRTKHQDLASLQIVNEGHVPWCQFVLLQQLPESKTCRLFTHGVSQLMPANCRSNVMSCNVSHWGGLNSFAINVQPIPGHRR